LKVKHSENLPGAYSVAGTNHEEQKNPTTLSAMHVAAAACGAFIFLFFVLCFVFHRCMPAAAETDNATDNETDEIICAICHEALGETLIKKKRIDEVMTSCNNNHTYHSGCLNNWILTKHATNQSATCPECREIITPATCANVERIFASVEKRWLKEQTYWETIIMYRDRYEQRYQISVKGCALSIWASPVSWYPLLLVRFYLWQVGWWVFKWVFEHPFFIDNVPTEKVQWFGGSKLTHYYIMISVGVVLSYNMRSDWEKLGILKKVMYICALALLSVTMITWICVHPHSHTPKVFFYSADDLCGSFWSDIDSQNSTQIIFAYNQYFPLPGNIKRVIIIGERIAYSPGGSPGRSCYIR